MINSTDTDDNEEKGTPFMELPLSESSDFDINLGDGIDP